MIAWYRRIMGTQLVSYSNPYGSSLACGIWICREVNTSKSSIECVGIVTLLWCGTHYVTWHEIYTSVHLISSARCLCVSIGILCCGFYCARGATDPF